MDQKAPVFSLVNVMRWTEFSASKVESAIETGEKLKKDADSVGRIKAQKCKACYYFGARIGGAAMTRQPCMACGKVQTYGSTATDKLCLDCANEHNLCKQCGGDREMRTGRRKWPEFPKLLDETGDTSEPSGRVFLLPLREEKQTPILKMCPHCGWQYDCTLPGNHNLVPAHGNPDEQDICPGAGQIPRAPADRRTLWQDLKGDE